MGGVGIMRIRRGRWWGGGSVCVGGYACGDQGNGRLLLFEKRKKEKDPTYPSFRTDASPIRLKSLVTRKDSGQGGTVYSKVA